MSLSSATLTGSVNPRGLATNYVFQYGATPGYGYQTPIVAVGNGTVAVKVSQTISGLQAGATYYYRLVAVSQAGTTNGTGHSFTVKSVPLKFALAKPPKQVVYKRAFTVSGMVSGTGSAGRQLVLLASTTPPQPGVPVSPTSFTLIGGPVTTNAAGAFVFRVPGLSRTTRLRVATLSTPGALPGAPGAKTTYSPIITEKVAVRVTAHVRSAGRPGYVRFYGTLAPAQVGATVVFELLKPGGRFAVVGKTVARRAGRGASRFNGQARIRGAGRYRAFVKVSAGAPVVSGSSGVIVIR